MELFSSDMHQPVEWDFPGLFPDIFAQPAPHDMNPQETFDTAQPIPTYQVFGGTCWSSMHQPVDWEPPTLPQLAPILANVTASQSTPQASSQPGAPAAAPPERRESAKRDRSARRGKSTTLRPQQQQMLELQKKLDALLQEHTVVEAENERLKTRLRVLEAVLPVREQAARLAQSNLARAAPQTDPVLANLLDMASGPSSCATSPTHGDIVTTTVPEDCDRKLELIASFGSPLLDPSPVAAESSAPCASLSCFHSSRSFQPSANPVAPSSSANPVAPVPSRHPNSESEARWMDAWRAWVREAALLLQAYDARPNEHYLRRLEEAFNKLKTEVVYLGLRHPELICNMRCVNLETGAEQEVPPDSFWSLVAAGMRLQPVQVANCKSALGLYRERMAVVLAERRGLTAQLGSCLGTLQLDEAEGRAGLGSMRREQLTLQAEEVTTALDANVAAEGHTTSLARDLLSSDLFSQLQCARASVLSYPYFPDALAIITAAVVEAEAAPEQPPWGCDSSTGGQAQAAQVAAST